MTAFVSLLCGILFAIGLAISGMTQPKNIINFLDITGSWDPALMFVMVGAISVHMLAYFAKNRLLSRPVLASKFTLPSKTKIDLPLLSGAAIFGFGWGISGFCPAPAISSLVSFNPQVVVFVVSLAVGMKLYSFVSNFSYKFRLKTDLSLKNNEKQT